MDSQSANSLQRVRQEEIVEASNMVFSSMVTRNYLRELESCEVLPYNESIQLPSVKWFRIDKIVMEKNVFFTDKLSMLYMALHKQARNVILVLNKQNDNEIELYLGARDLYGNFKISSEILESGLEGYFPGIGFSTQNQLPEMNYSKPSVASVSAIASLRDDKKEDFVQGLERLINATYSLPKFRAYFIAERVGTEDCEMMIKSFADLYTSLSPAETLQMTYSESESKGVTESFTKSFSKTIGESISKTISHTEGDSENVTQGTSNSYSTSENYTGDILDNLVTSIFGGETGYSDSKSRSHNYSKSIGKNFSDSTSTQTGENSSEQEGTSEQKGTSDNKTKGYSKQITYKNRTAKFYLDILDKQLERLQNGEPFGLWSVATYFVANDMTSALQLANIYRGAIIGEESGLESCSINSWNNENSASREICKYLDHNIHPHFNYNSLNVTAGSVVTSKELAIHLSLPQASVPGIIVEERATFARNVSSPKLSENMLDLGKILHLGRVFDTPVKLDIDELTKHTFVTGTTGSGKSNTMYLLLSQLKENGKKILVIEPTKGEYKNIFSDADVYGSNPKKTRLLRMNPFEFSDEIHIYEHIDRLVEIFNACWPMYAAMPVVLKKSITDAYRKCGWNLETSTWGSSEISNYKLFPTFQDVVLSLRDFINNSEYSAETKGDYKGALETRLLSLSEGLTGQMLGSNCGVIPDEDLFEKNVIVDLSRVNNTETKSLIMGLLVMKLNEYYQVKGDMNSKLKHVTVLEEAHNLLKRTSKEQSQEGSNLAGKSVEMICNSIAEMRTYGEGFIIVDQSPSQVDLAAIRNTNTKIIMGLPEDDDRVTAGKSIGLDDEHIEQISRLKVGEALVYQNIWEEPVQCKINKAECVEVLYTNKKDTFILDTGLNYKQIIIEFLYDYCSERLESDYNYIKIENAIKESSLSSILKYNLLKLVFNTKIEGVNLKERNHEKVMGMVSVCLGVSDKTRLLIAKHQNNIIELNNGIIDVIKTELPNQPYEFYRFCTRCVLRQMVSESSKYTELYNKWYFHQYKK